MYGNAVICGVFGHCRCQSAWMDGATSCSWVFVRECTHVHFTKKIPTIWTIYDLQKKRPKTQMQHRKKLCGSKRSTSGPTYQRDLPSSTFMLNTVSNAAWKTCRSRLLWIPPICGSSSNHGSSHSQPRHTQRPAYDSHFLYG